MLTGRKPHEGESPIQVAYKHVHEDVPAAVAARAAASRRTSTRWSPAPPPATATCARPTRGCCSPGPPGPRRRSTHGVLDDPELTADLLPAVPSRSPTSIDYVEERLDRRTRPTGEAATTI